MKFLIGTVMVIGLASVAGSIVVGQKVFDGKVVDKPYETGLLWDRMQKEKAALNVDVKGRNLGIGDNEIDFSVLDRNGNPLRNAEVSVTISRPSTTIYDVNYPARQTGGGYYRTTVRLPLYGHWDMKIRIIRESGELTFEKRIYAEG